MLARPVILGSVTFNDPVLPSTCKSAPCQTNNPARVTTNEGTANFEKRKPCAQPIAAPRQLAQAHARAQARLAGFDAFLHPRILQRRVPVMVAVDEEQRPAAKSVLRQFLDLQWAGPRHQLHALPDAGRCARSG